MDKIPIFKLQFDADFRRKFQQGCEQIFDEGYLTNHTMVRKSEDLFKEKNSSSRALAVSHGTAALEVALRAIDVREKEVILPTNTFIATLIAVRSAGGIPVLADVEPEYFSIDPEDVMRKISTKTKAVITVHVGGHISPSIRALQQVCQDHGLSLVEDAAHAHFAELDGVKAGNFGDVGCFSFHMTKVITSGEGGMLTISRNDLFERAFSIRQFGMDPTHPISHVRDGSNFKMGEFAGLCLLLDMERAEGRIRKRRELAGLYQARLKGSGWKCLVDLGGMTSSYYKQIILPPRGVTRQMVANRLASEGISLTNGVYYIPLHQQPSSQEFVAKSCSFPVADAFSRDHICPPCYPELELHEVDRICDVLLDISRRGA